MRLALGRLERFGLGSIVYLGISALWIYGVLDRGSLEGSDVPVWSALGVVAAAHVAFGFTIREWPALLLPIAVLLLAIPAGYPDSEFSEPGPVWFGQIVLVQFEIPLIAAGLGLRAVVVGRRNVAIKQRRA
jgi:hypothetical protein